MTSIQTIFIVIALLMFLAGAAQIQPPRLPVNWTSLGLAFLVIAYLLRA